MGNDKGAWSNLGKVKVENKKIRQFDNKPYNKYSQNLIAFSNEHATSLRKVFGDSVNIFVTENLS